MTLNDKETTDKTDPLPKSSTASLCFLLFEAGVFLNTEDVPSGLLATSLTLFELLVLDRVTRNAAADLIFVGVVILDGCGDVTLADVADADVNFLSSDDAFDRLGNVNFVGFGDVTFVALGDVNFTGFGDPNFNGFGDAIFVAFGDVTFVIFDDITFAGLGDVNFLGFGEITFVTFGDITFAALGDVNFLGSGDVSSDFFSDTISFNFLVDRFADETDLVIFLGDGVEDLPAAFVWVTAILLLELSLVFKTLMSFTLVLVPRTQVSEVFLTFLLTKGLEASFFGEEFIELFLTGDSTEGLFCLTGEDEILVLLVFCEDRVAPSFRLFVDPSLLFFAVG